MVARIRDLKFKLSDKMHHLYLRPSTDNAAVLTHIEAQEILDLWKNILLLGSGVLDIAPAEETFFSSSHR